MPGETPNPATAAAPVPPGASHETAGLAAATDASKASGLQALLGRLAGVLEAMAGGRKALAAGGGASQAFAKKVLGTILAILTLPRLILGGNLNTRLVVTGFLASVALFAMTSTQLYRIYLADLRKPKPEAQRSAMAAGMSQFIKGQKEIAVATKNLVFLERFSASVSSQSGNVQVFEVEMYVESDTPETSEVIKSHLNDVKETVAVSIQEQAYDRLLTDDGKAELKRRIGEAITKELKAWKWNGSVKTVYFTRFILG